MDETFGFDDEFESGDLFDAFSEETPPRSKSPVGQKKPALRQAPQKQSVVRANPIGVQKQKAPQGQGKPQGAPQRKPQGTPQRKPQGTPQGKPQGTPQGKPQGTPQRKPQGTPQRKPQGQARPQGQTVRPQNSAVKPQGTTATPPHKKVQQGRVVQDIDRGLEQFVDSETAQPARKVPKQRVPQEQQMGNGLPNPNMSKKSNRGGQVPPNIPPNTPQGFDDEVWGDDTTQVVPPKKKKGSLLVKLILAVLVVIVVIFGYRYVKTHFLDNAEEEVETAAPSVDYTGSPHDVLVALQGALQNYDADAIGTLLVSEGTENVSYLAQEWSYANNNEIRQEWIKKVASLTSFSFPQDASGMDSPLTDGKGLTITVVDYAALASGVAGRREQLLETKEIKGYTNDDYEVQDECTDLMLEDLNNMPDIPLTTVTVDLTFNDDGTLNDSVIDDVLYGSDAWHNLCDEYDKVLSEFTGYTTESYKEKVEVHNKEYDRWYKLFKKYYKKDKGHFHKGTSKWEPWYKRDKHNRILKDKNGKKIVNYYSIKDKNGKDWVQPSKTKWVTKTKTRQVEVEYVPETVITHCFIGAYYCQNEYDGIANPAVRIGDGSLEQPAGIGTPIVTEALCKDGKYHDVRVELTAYWVGQDAISYCMDFSEKNRGLDPDAVVQYVTYEVSVTNLEDDEIALESTEMCLCDAHQNKSPRTGIMYGFSNENITIAGHSTVVVNDWASSTEILQKYVAWGKSFERDKNMVYFRVLAGEGDVPEYSAYKAFTGQMSESGSNAVESSITATPEPTPEPTIPPELLEPSEDEDSEDVDIEEE